VCSIEQVVRCPICCEARPVQHPSTLQRNIVLRNVVDRFRKEAHSKEEEDRRQMQRNTYNPQRMIELKVGRSSFMDQRCCTATSQLRDCCSACCATRVARSRRPRNARNATSYTVTAVEYSIPRGASLPVWHQAHALSALLQNAPIACLVTDHKLLPLDASRAAPARLARVHYCLSHPEYKLDLFCTACKTPAYAARLIRALLPGLIERILRVAVVHTVCWSEPTRITRVRR